MIYNAHRYQQHATDIILEKEATGLFMEMGLGKTVATLTAIKELVHDRFEIDKVLVIAPKRVAEHTWSTESQKWDHLTDLRIAKVLGSSKQRMDALKAKADIYVINRENVPWLVGILGGHWPFDMLVIDELSSFKSAKSQRFKALRTARPRCKKVVGLTGTPTPNGLIDLWPQMYLLDMGVRLGKSITAYRNAFFVPGKSNGVVVFNYKLKKDSEKAIYSRIEDICVSMSANDYLELPERLDNDVVIDLGHNLKKQYDDFEESQVLALQTDEEVSAVNAAALTNKLLQFANGAIYDEDKKVHHVHDLKLDALEEIIEATNGKPVLVFYSYRHDTERIKSRIGGVKLLDGEKDIDAWNKGKIPVLLAHPASAGHGLNLQDGGSHIVWFGLPWSLELYQQSVARLHRQGQTQQVINHRIITKGTMEEDVLASLTRKAVGQQSLMEAVKARIEKYFKKPC